MNRSVSLQLFIGLRKKKEVATICFTLPGRCATNHPFSAGRLIVTGDPLLTLLLFPFARALVIRVAKIVHGALQQAIENSVRNVGRLRD